jgi:hypothetical protein
VAELEKLIEVADHLLLLSRIKPFKVSPFVVTMCPGTMFDWPNEKP